MSGKFQPVTPAGIITIEDIMAWYKTNPWPLGAIDAVAPLEETDQDTWKTIQNAAYELNEAADPISSGSSVPVAGREGYVSVMGGFGEFGKGRDMDSDQLEKFNNLKIKFAKLRSPQVAQQLVNFYGNDLAFVRRAVQAERTYLTYALLSNACSISFLQANSPYLRGIAAMAYPVASWQKTNTSASWATASTEILTDIQGIIDLAEGYGVRLSKIKINKTWFNHVRNNTQVQKQCATLVQNIFSVENRPTLATVNAMLQVYFDQNIAFEVVDEQITRAAIDDTKTTANPFADGVAVFTVTTQVGRFVHKPIYIDSPDKEAYESFFLVGQKKETDPNYSKIYAKAKGFPVIDSYNDNVYLKINAVAW
jgi:hypothetical protein